MSSPGPSGERRELPEARDDLLMDGVPRLGAIHSEHPFPVCVVLQQWHRPFQIYMQAMLDDLFGIVRAALPGQQSADQLLPWNVEVDCGLHFDAKCVRGGKGRLRLFDGARESVEDIAARFGCGYDRFAQHVHDHAIGDQIAVVNVGLDLLPERCLVLDVLAQQVATGDVRDAESLRQKLSLCSLTSARSANQQEPHLISRAPTWPVPRQVRGYQCVRGCCARCASSWRDRPSTPSTSSDG